MARKILSVLLLLGVISMLLWAAVPTDVSAYELPPGQDADFVLVDGYWPMENAGPGKLVYASGSVEYYTGPASGWLDYPQGYPDPSGDMSWGSEVDREFVRFIKPIYCVWDLGAPFSEVVVFPFVDDYGIGEGLEFKVWGSNDFDASDPGMATWVAADLDKVYSKGWSGVGEGIYSNCSDDYVSVWDWKSGAGSGDCYRFVKVQSTWDSPVWASDPEIDAVKGVVETSCWPGEGGWQQTIVERGRVFSYTSLAIGYDGKVHIAYGGEQLYYSLWDGCTWQEKEIESGGVGEYCSLALDSMGNPAISYYDATDGALKYAHWNGMGWNIETVDNDGDVGQYTSLAFDRSGNPAISYYDATNDDLKYARWNGTSWQIERVDSAGWVGSYTSLDFDTSGYPGISYYDATNGDLKYAQWTCCDWDIETVDSDGWVGAYTSLALDNSGNPAISYYDATNGALKYAWRCSPTCGWSIEEVDSAGDVGTYTSLAFDTSVIPWKPAISYYDVTNGALKYAQLSGDSWDVKTVDDRGDVGTYTSLAFDRLGNPGISYYDASNDYLKYAHWDGAGWDRETVYSIGDIGRYTSFAFDSSDNPAISYYDVRHGSLKYAHWDDEGCDIETVDNDGDVGSYTSLAFDSTDSPGISYYDATKGDLKYAHWNGTGWATMPPVDSAGDVGSYTSLAFDSTDNPAISYYDVTNGALKYARWNGSNWVGAAASSSVPDTVDSEGNVGQYTCLAFDRASPANPAISYYDASNDYLKYAHWNGTRWVVETVDSVGWVGTYTSLAFNSSGNPAISYHDATNGDLKYAHWEGTSWDIETVDSKGWVGTYTSLAFDSSGNPAISYHDATKGDLKYAHWNGTSWDIATVDSFGWVGTYTSLAFDSSGNPAISYDEATHDDLRYAYFPNEAPQQPSNISPADEDTGVSLTPTLVSSEFGDPDEGDTHAASQWQVTTTAGDYSSPVFEKTDTLNLTQITIPAETLSYDTTYYWRVRYEDNHDNWAGYSLETSFTTQSVPNQIPNQPSNLSPADGATDVRLTFTLQSSAFSDPDGDSHTASQWQIATDNQFTNMVYNPGVDTSNLITIDITSPNNNATYYWRVRHQDNRGDWSAWSAETSFTTEGSSGLFSSSLIWIFLVVIVLVAGAAIIGWWFLSKSPRKKAAQKAANRPKSPYH